MRLKIFFLIIGLLGAPFGASGCATAKKPGPVIGSLYAGTVRVRRTPLTPERETVGGNPADFGCQDFLTFLNDVKLTPLRACLATLKDEVTVFYRLRRRNQPLLELMNPEKAPACLREALPEIPVPREVVFQSRAEGRLRCYASRLDLEADELLGAKVPRHRKDLRLVFLTSKTPRTDAELGRVVAGWVLSVLWSEEAGGLPSEHLSESLCSACLSPTVMMDEHSPPQPSWP